MRLRRLVGSALLPAFAVSAPALAGSMRAIDLGVNTWLVQRRDHAGAPSVVLRQRDGDISTSIDAGTPFAVWASPDASTGEDALAMRIDPERRPPDASQKSKVEINVARQDDDALDARFDHRFVLRSGGSAALGFTFKMDEAAYDDPQRWVLHMQVWQCCSLATMPALALQAVPGPGAPAGTVRFALIARDDDFRAAHQTSAYGDHLRFDDGADTIALAKGRAYRIVLALSPDPGTRVGDHMESRTGAIGMWVDGRPVLHHAGPWGYSADPLADVQPTYAVKLGIYRAAQPARQQIYFSAIRWGTDRAAVEAATR